MAVLKNKAIQYTDFNSDFIETISGAIFTFHFTNEWLSFTRSGTHLPAWLWDHGMNNNIDHPNHHKIGHLSSGDFTLH